MGSSATGRTRPTICAAEDSPSLAQSTDVVRSDEVAAALRDLRLLDTDCERLVFRIRADGDRAILRATDDEFDELIGFVAAGANHEPNRRRLQRLHAAFATLGDAAQTHNGG
jgi:hypothetical protein